MRWRPSWRGVNLSTGPTSMTSAFHRERPASISSTARNNGAREWPLMMGSELSCRVCWICPRTIVRTVWPVRGPNAQRRTANGAPDDGDELAARATTLESAERWADAFKDRDRIVELRGDRAWSWADRARCHRKLNQFDEALGDYERALELAPGNAWIRIGRAGVYRDAKRHDEALADYGVVLANEPGNADALIRRVSLLKKLKRFREARDDLNRAADAKPGDSYILTQRAIFYRNLAVQGVNDIDDSEPED